MDNKREMTESEADERHDERVLQQEIRLEIKETRHEKLLTYADNAAPSGFRGMTKAEREAHEYIATLVEQFDTEIVEPGQVGIVFFSDNGQPDVEWCSEEARAAAGGAT